MRTPGGCRIARPSADAERSINRVGRSSGVIANRMVTGEFTIDADGSFNQAGVEKGFEFDSRCVYPVERDPNCDCICNHLERYGRPIADRRASDGTLFSSFSAPDIETVREIVTDRHESSDEIFVRELTLLRRDG